MTNKKSIWFIGFAAFLLVAPMAYSLGMSAGVVNFGEVPRGGSETLTYTILNNDESPMTISTEVQGGISNVVTATPSLAVIPGSGSQLITVTLKVPRNAQVGELYEGSVLVTAAMSDSGDLGAVGAKVQLAARKNVLGVAGAEVAPTGSLLTGVGGSSSMLLLFIIILILVGYAYYKHKN